MMPAMPARPVLGGRHRATPRGGVIARPCSGVRAVPARTVASGLFRLNRNLLQEPENPPHGFIPDVIALHEDFMPSSRKEPQLAIRHAPAGMLLGFWPDHLVESRLEQHHRYADQSRIAPGTPARIHALAQPPLRGPAIPVSRRDGISCSSHSDQRAWLRVKMFSAKAPGSHGPRQGQ